MILHQGVGVTSPSSTPHFPLLVMRNWSQVMQVNWCILKPSYPFRTVAVTNNNSVGGILRVGKGRWEMLSELPLPWIQHETMANKTA